MFVVHSYPTAIFLCIVTMFCWGSWANMLKLEPRTYPFPFFYWDQAIGYILLPLVVGLTLGSLGSEGRGLIADLTQGNASTYGWALLGGAVWNLANILFMSALDLAGMAIAYPVAIGLALIEGVVVNYIADPKGSPTLIFGGVALITLAIILDALAYRNVHAKAAEPSHLGKGISLAVSGGILMGLFYFFVQRSISSDFTVLTPGKFGPYAAVLVYAFGAFASTAIFNTYLMSHPIKGTRVTYSQYFEGGRLNLHMIGALGGVINGVGVISSFVAAKVASPAIAYGLGQGGTMVAAIWGVFVWKEMKGASRFTYGLIAAMFLCFISGLSLLVISMI